MGPYRGDRTSLLLRCEALEREMAELRALTTSLEPSLERWLRAKQRTESLRHELTVARMQLEAFGPEPAPARILANATIASPCSAKWEDMPGDERIRYCGGCSKNVYNLSAMSRDEAAALLHRNADMCVRFYRREDGTILTGDCTVGARKKRRRRAALAVSGGLIAASTLTTAGLARRQVCSAAPPAETSASPPTETVASPPSTPNRFLSPVPAPHSRAYMGGVGFAQPTAQPTGVAVGPGLVNGGGLTTEQIRRVVMAHTGALRACYESEVQRQPGLHGGVTVSFTVAADGSVSDAAVAISTLQSPRVEACILRQLKAWRFPAGEGPTTVLAYPFRFGVGS